MFWSAILTADKTVVQLMQILYDPQDKHDSLIVVLAWKLNFWGTDLLCVAEENQKQCIKRIKKNLLGIFHDMKTIVTSSD